MIDAAKLLDQLENPIVRYVIVDAETGKVKRAGDCPASLVDHHVGPGEIFVERHDGLGDPSRLVYDFSTGELVIATG